MSSAAYQAIVSDILAQPEHERLEHALSYIHDMMDEELDEAHWRNKLGVTPMAARIMGQLWKRAGVIVDYDSLVLVTGCRDVEALKVHVSHVRAALRDAGIKKGITCSYGYGYGMKPEAVAAVIAAGLDPVIGEPGMPPDRNCSPWTAEDDEELRRMYERGDLIDVISYELDRTRCSVQQRVFVLGIKRSEK